MGAFGGPELPTSCPRCAVGSPAGRTERRAPGSLGSLADPSSQEGERPPCDKARDGGVREFCDMLRRVGAAGAGATAGPHGVPGPPPAPGSSGTPLARGSAAVRAGWPEGGTQAPVPRPAGTGRPNPGPSPPILLPPTSESGPAAPPPPALKARRAAGRIQGRLGLPLAGERHVRRRAAAIGPGRWRGRGGGRDRGETRSPCAGRGRGGRRRLWGARGARRAAAARATAGASSASAVSVAGRRGGWRPGLAGLQRGGGRRGAA